MVGKLLPARERINRKERRGRKVWKTLRSLRLFFRALCSPSLEIGPLSILRLVAVNLRHKPPYRRPAPRRSTNVSGRIFGKQRFRFFEVWLRCFLATAKHLRRVEFRDAAQQVDAWIVGVHLLRLIQLSVEGLAPFLPPTLRVHTNAGVGQQGAQDVCFVGFLAEEFYGGGEVLFTGVQQRVFFSRFFFIVGKLGFGISSVVRCDPLVGPLLGDELEAIAQRGFGSRVVPRRVEGGDGGGEGRGVVLSNGRRVSM